MVKRKRCKMCQHENCDEFEERINGLTQTADDLDKEMGWSSGTAARHMRNHAATDYDDKSNPRCALCTDPQRVELEMGIKNEDVTVKEVADILGCSAHQVRKHIADHLQPLVQKSAATLIAAKDINEIEILSKNVQLLDVKVREWMDRDDLTPKEADTLVKLAKEVRESLKYLLEFKGKLIHKRQDTIIVAQMQIVQEVLAQQHPSVWLDIKKKMQEDLQ